MRTLRDKLNEAARKIAKAQGWEVAEGHDISRGTDARSRQFWGATVVAYEAFFGDRPDDLDEPIDDEPPEEGAVR